MMSKRTKLNQPPIIFLTGFSGSGKSTVGPLLAHKLSWRFLDTDHLIESRYRQPIGRLFELRGEKWFRQVEARTIGRLCRTARQPAIVALGGGALVSLTNRRQIFARGQVIHLSASIPILYRRLRKATDRPLLVDRAGKALPKPVALKRLADLLRQRITGYQKAHFKVATDRRTPKMVADRIAVWYRSAHEAD